MIGNGQVVCNTFFMGRIPDHIKVAIEKMCEALAEEAVMLYEAGVVGETIEDQLSVALDSLSADTNLAEDKNYVYKKSGLQ